MLFTDYISSRSFTDAGCFSLLLDYFSTASSEAFTVSALAEFPQSEYFSDTDSAFIESAFIESAFSSIFSGTVSSMVYSVSFASRLDCCYCLTEPLFDIFMEVSSKFFLFSASCLNEALSEAGTSYCLTEIFTEPMADPFIECKGVLTDYKGFSDALTDPFIDINGFSEPFIDCNADFTDPLADKSGFSDSFIDLCEAIGVPFTDFMDSNGFSETTFTDSSGFMDYNVFSEALIDPKGFSDPLIDSKGFMLPFTDDNTFSDCLIDPFNDYKGFTDPLSDSS